MQKVAKAVLAVAGRVLFIGFSIQIILGICWMLCNFTGFQRFGESLLCEEIGKTLICDEYEGILYPVLILVTKGMEELILVPYRFILYLLQIGFAFWVSYQLLGSFCVQEKSRRVWGALAMLTFPMAMQCHLAVLPDSFVSSLLLLELAVVSGILINGRRVTPGSFVKALACWALAVLLRPEYLYIGILPLVLLPLYGLGKAWKDDRKRMWYPLTLLALVVVLGGLLLMVKNFTQEEGCYDRVTKSRNAAMVSRLAWPYAGTDYEFWPGEVKAQFTFEEARQIDYYADHMDRILGRTLEEALGKERAEELFGEIAEIAWQNHKNEILHRTVWDAVGYTVSPLVLQRQFTGKIYDSYSGRNYDIMRSKTPFLTKYYMDYSCMWFGAALVLTAVLEGVRLAAGLTEKAERRKRLQRLGRWLLTAVCCVFSLGVLVLVYTLRGAGMMDYKKSIAVTLLWICWMLSSCLRGMREQR